MALEHIRIAASGALSSQLRNCGQQARSLRDNVKFVFGVMNDCYVDTGNVANNDYAELEYVFGITAAGSGSVGTGSNGYKAWYKIGTLKADLDSAAAHIDAVANDLA